MRNVSRVYTSEVMALGPGAGIRWTATPLIVSSAASPGWRRVSTCLQEGGNLCQLTLGPPHQRVVAQDEHDDTELICHWASLVLAGSVPRVARIC